MLSNDKDNQEFEQDFNAKEEALKTSKVRKRIDELLERRRLKELLDDSDDWDI